MSVELVNAEIARFLANSEPGVLCVRGKWGVGKTYSWTHQLAAAQAAGRLGILKYSYVSLFGVNSLDALKYAVFENSQIVGRGIRIPNFETFEELVERMPKWRKWVKTVLSGSFASRAIGPEGVLSLSFMAVRDQIVCIDDFERRSENLKPVDILGLVSFLREQRNCKVVLILNDERLDGSGKQEFERHLEKVVDVWLAYDPSPAQSARIGVGNADEAGQYIVDRCVALGITNIRVIKRIVGLVDAVRSKLAGCDSEVLRAAITSLALFCWSHDQPDEAPSLSYLESLTQDQFATRSARSEGSPEEDESGWRAALDAYGYGWTDELDLALIEAVRKGYFDDEKLEAAASKLSAKLARNRIEGSFESAWGKFHGSFAGDQDQVLDGIFDAFKNNVEFISATNLNGTFSVFKRLGRYDQAKAMLDLYVKSHEDRAAFDLAGFFGEYVDEPEIRAAFVAKLEAPAEIPDTGAMLFGIKDGAWSPELLAALASTPAAEVLRVFKSHSGAELRQLIASALQFARVGNATPEMNEITQRAKEALRTIGSESPINALRVSRLGITVPPLPNRSLMEVKRAKHA